MHHTLLLNFKIKINKMKKQELKFYRNDSNPLEEIIPEELKINELFVSSRGIRYKHLGEGVFVIDKSSELIDTEVVESLDPGESPNSLGLYWILMKNKI